MTTEKKIILGSECDDLLWRKLQSVIAELGGRLEKKKWGLVGSQEVESFEAKIRGDILSIESETYIGVSISGKCALVDKIKSMI